MRDHRQSKAFQLADELVILVYELTRDFPKEKAIGLCAPLRRRAVSVPSNIVEGCASYSSPDHLGYPEVAFGSFRELSYQMELSSRLGYLKETARADLKKKLTNSSLPRYVADADPSTPESLNFSIPFRP